MKPVNQRHRELHIGPVGPWAAEITVDAVETNHGRQSTLPHDHLFEVAVEWTGPPAIGFPPSATPVSARDVYVLPSLEDARVLARKAADAWRAGGDEAPDLRELAGAK